jgi:DNA-binding CsgD family transcriptional regulator
MSARSPDETELISMLIGDIYDGALDPSLWPLVLEKSANFVGGVASALFVKDSVRKTQNNICTWGYDPDYTRVYFEKFIPLDPFTTGQFFFEIEDLVAVADMMSHAEHRESRFYKEWVRPQGWIDAIGATLDRSATTYAVFSVIRHERNGIVDNETRRRMKLIVPHVRRAVLIGKMIDLRKVEAAALADTLDGLTAAMFLVDSEGRIMHANAAGHVMLADGSVICAVGGKLTVADQALCGSLLDVGCEDFAVGRKGACLPVRGRNGEDYVAHVLSLTGGTRRQAGAAYSAVAAVFVRKAEIELPHPVEALAKRHKLTAAEMRVLFAIVEIGGVSDVARILGISEATVKTHLQRVFDKTGAARQADLVKLVAGFASPFGG